MSTDPETQRRIDQLDALAAHEGVPPEIREQLRARREALAAQPIPPPASATGPVDEAAE